MGLHIVQEEMRRRWAGGWPDIVHMEALDIAFRRDEGQLFLDMGEIDDFFTFYNNVADDVNSLCREDILPIVGVACEGKPVDTATLVGGIHFAIPMMMPGGEDFGLHVICYKLDRKFSAAGYFIKGQQEVEALLAMDRKDIVARKIAPDDYDDEKVPVYLGGVYAARQHCIPDTEIRKYLKKGFKKDPVA